MSGISLTNTIRHYKNQMQTTEVQTNNQMVAANNRQDQMPPSIALLMTLIVLSLWIRTKDFRD